VVEVGGGRNGWRTTREVEVEIEIEVEEGRRRGSRRGGRGLIGIEEEGGWGHLRWRR